MQELDVGLLAGPSGPTGLERPHRRQPSRERGAAGIVPNERLEASQASTMEMRESMAKQVAEGDGVLFKPRGNSMRPIINSGALIVVEPPADPSTLEVGDVVLVRVSGATYLHLVDAVDLDRQRVRIANNRSHVNGWAPFRQLHGICSELEGGARPGTRPKVRSADVAG